MTSDEWEGRAPSRPLRDDDALVDEIESYSHEYFRTRRGRVSPRSKDKLFL